MNDIRSRLEHEMETAVSRLRPLGGAVAVMDILKRAGYPAQTMLHTLTWLAQTSGTEGGGFFATRRGDQF